MRNSVRKSVLEVRNQLRMGIHKNKYPIYSFSGIFWQVYGIFLVFVAHYFSSLNFSKLCDVCMSSQMTLPYPRQIAAASLITGA